MRATTTRAICENVRFCSPQCVLEAELTTAPITSKPTTLMILFSIRHHLAFRYFLSSLQRRSASPASCAIIAAWTSSSLPAICFSRSPGLVGCFGRGRTAPSIQKRGIMKPSTKSKTWRLHRHLTKVSKLSTKLGAFHIDKRF